VPNLEADTNQPNHASKQPSLKMHSGFQHIKGATTAMSKDELELDPSQLELMIDNALAAADFLKALAHEGRLMILCHLASGEKSVSDLEGLLHSRQAAVSQQLARLRLEGLVKYRREGKVIYYQLNDTKSARVIDLLYDLFCDIEGEGAKPGYTPTK